MDAFFLAITFHVFPLLISCQLFSTGNFYAQTTGQDDEMHGGDNMMKLNEDFLKCGARQSCVDVIKTKRTDEYRAIKEADIINTPNNPDAIWKKFPTNSYAWRKSCKSLHDNLKIIEAGTHDIHAEGNKDRIKLFCDMKSEGGPWMVIQRHINNAVNFNVPWKEFKAGIGNSSDANFFIGLENLHRLTLPGKNASLRIDLKHLKHNDTLYHAEYSQFEVASEDDHYRLTIDGYTGTAGGNSMDKHNGMPFTTIDRNNNPRNDTNCAVAKKGGWWYRTRPTSHARCQDANLFAWPMTWRKLNEGGNGDIIFSEMKIKYH